MKIKLLILTTVVCAGIYSAFACSYSECRGGNVKCCATGGSIYYAKGGGE